VINVVTVLPALLLSGSAVAHPPSHFTVVERPSNETVLHRLGDTDSLGDLIVFSNPLYDAHDAVAIGTSSGQCVRTQVGVSWECQFTLRLARGAIVVAGRYDDEGDSTVAVIGGTGQYARAHGTLVIHPQDAAHSRYDFILTL
jgi:allene oxide cyclase